VGHGRARQGREGEVGGNGWSFAWSRWLRPYT
jgi:hypothetical protein